MERLAYPPAASVRAQAVIQRPGMAADSLSFPLRERENAGLVGGYTSALRSTPPISPKASRAPRPIAEGWVKP
jgi:hypothetical protein